MMSKESRFILPQSFIPFILEHLEEFEARVVGDTIVIAVKQNGSPQAKRGPVEVASLAPAIRPKFVYKVVDKKLTPESAARYGFSEQRLKVYSAIHSAPATGIQSKDLLTKTGLAHGTVQQILHWLRARKLISGEPVS